MEKSHIKIAGRDMELDGMQTTLLRAAGLQPNGLPAIKARGLFGVVRERLIRLGFVMTLPC